MLTDHYQNAYVTADLDRAMALLTEQFGPVNPPFCMDVTQMYHTPNGDGEGILRLGFLQVGRLQYELIQPISGNVAIYADAVQADQPMRFHHVAMRSHDLDKTRADSIAQGRPIVLEGEAGDLRFLYADARATLGHYLEYVDAPESFWEMMRAQGG